MNNKIKMLFIVMCITVLCICACGKKEKQAENNNSSQLTVAVHAGDTNVYQEEAKYYLYTAQATYESLYISDGKNIDWNSKMSGNTSWEDGVKSLVLDDICRRECMYAKAGEYNVSLSEDEIKSIDIDVDKYFSDSNEKLINKIDIDEKTLKKVFEKDAIADKVEEIMAASDKNLPDETYNQWKKDNVVTAEKQWDDIDFTEHIFTVDDINKIEEKNKTEE